MPVSFGLTKLRLHDGTVVEPPSDGMTIFTGPNNSGKSALLRELVSALHHHPGNAGQKTHWVDSLEINRDGTSEELLTWLKERGHETRWHRPTGRTYLTPRLNQEDNGVDVDELRSAWTSGYFHSISYLLVSDQWTDQRLQDQTTSHFWDQARPPNHPTQRLWEDLDTHSRFSDLFKNAFGMPLSINRYVPSIQLQIGSTGMPDTAPPASPELREAYNSLPRLAEQGDGMRAFTNLLLHTLVRPAPIIVIDEPEAFLHPPQARLLGKYLVLHTPSPCQVFVATHSADFLSGVLEGNAANQKASHKALSLARISRAGDTITARTLKSENVTEILDTPLLRYSNIVSGLFHDGVVLCEAEGDCHFYAATIDTLRADSRSFNLTFLHVNGKARLADAAHKLRTCGIPTAIVADFDFLNDGTKIRQAMGLLGGNWEEVREDVKTLQGYASSSIVTKPASDIKKEIIAAIGNPRGKETLSQSTIDQITKSLAATSGWKFLKNSGLAALSGEPHNAAARLLAYFAQLGLFLVPVGELECWVREVPSSNKGAWLTRVFEERLHERPNADLRVFSNAITSFLVPDTDSQ